MISPAQSGLPRGTTLGRYVVLERLGAGSMGVVYAAYDPQLDRKVALKLVRPDGSGFASDEGGGRLLREAQAMARLSHPNVVQVYDAGALPGGGEGDDQVFIAMEHVEGRTLRAWLAERPRTLDEILAVFERAGRGLAAAHAAGVVHRDFKPENVLVDAQGRPRVTDFGLARSAGRDRAAPRPADGSAPVAPTLTSTGVVLGTPAYAAPEQFTGDPVDHRTDQFSFCVSLYEALYGERPFAADSESELVFSVTMGRFRPAPKDSRVPGWLREVVLRGLAPLAEKRHPSMDRLLHALARRDPKRRRWMAAGLAAAAAIVIAAGTYGAVLVGRARAGRCQGAARNLEGVWDEQRRREVATALLATRRPFSAVAARGAVQALDAYAEKWSAMYTDTCQATRVRGEQSEALMDLRMRCLGRRLNELTVVVDLLSHADARLAERAVEVAQGLRGLEICADREALESAVEPADERLRGSVEAARRELDRARGLLSAGRYAEALQTVRPLVERARALGYRPLVAEALLMRGDAEIESTDSQTAKETLRQAVREAEIARDDEVRGSALSSLVRVTGLWLGEYQEAYRCADEAQAVAERLGPGNDALRARTYTVLGLVLEDEGRAAEALAQFQAALAIRERTLPPEHGDILKTRQYTAAVLIDLGRNEEGTAEERRVIPALEAALGAEHPTVAIAHNNLGAGLRCLGRYQEALEQYERALAIQRAVLGEQDVRVTYELAGVAYARACLGDPHAALPQAEDALRRIERFEGRTLIWAQVTSEMGEILRAIGDVRAARAQEELALAAAKKAGGPEHPLVADALHRIAECDLAAGRPAAALAELRQAAAIREKRLGSEHPDLAPDLGGVGQALIALGRPAEALPLLERARQLAREVPPGEAGRIAFALARARWKLGQRRQAVEDAQSALEVLSRGEGIDRRSIPAVKAWLARRGAAASTPARAP